MHSLECGLSQGLPAGFDDVVRSEALVIEDLVWSPALTESAHCQADLTGADDGADVVEEALFASTQDAASDIWEPGDGRFRIRFFENREMLPFEWRSVLSVYEKDAKGNDYEVDLGSEEDREIRVNDYFTYGNYHFFQTNAIPEDPTYSGIGVVYDRGIPWVLTGMYTIIAGAVIAFLVRPAVLAFRSRKESAA